MNLFLVCPATRNIGNDLIAHATSRLLYETFGADANIVTIPALKGPQFGGLVARQVYDMNRLADAVVLGGGNLFENGQLSYEAQAVEALRPPMLLMGLSHGRIAAGDGSLAPRSDSLPPEAVRHLVKRSTVAMVRDQASLVCLEGLGAPVQLGGCPTLFLPANPPDWRPDGDVIISVRHPLRMSVPPALQWRIPEDLRRIIALLRAEYARPVWLACHDYVDLEFAAGFPDARPIYFDQVERYLATLRHCVLHVGYRLHGFLPSFAFGSPSIHLSYDERGQSMLRTVGMESWDIDLLEEPDCASAVLDRARSIGLYVKARHAAQPAIAALRQTTTQGLARLRSVVASTRPTRETFA